MTKKVWLLTSEYNAYDQYGEYFEAIFKDIPTKEQLMKYGCNSDEDVEHMLSGGGRKKYEDSWYNLREEEIQ